MFQVGFCYGGVEGKSGFRPGEVYKTKAEAVKAVRDQFDFPERVYFVETGGKHRAYLHGSDPTAVMDGVPTGHIFFEVDTPELWIVVDRFALGNQQKKVVEFRGTLKDAKNFAKKKGATGFHRTGDNVAAYSTNLILVRIN